LKDFADTVNILVPVGALGAGVREVGRRRPALPPVPTASPATAGSTDSGPAYLATGRSKYSRDAVKTDLAILMLRAASPLAQSRC